MIPMMMMTVDPWWIWEWSIKVWLAIVCEMKDISL